MGPLGNDSPLPKRILTMTDTQIARELLKTAKLLTASSPYSVKTMEALAEVMSSGMDKMSERNFIQKAIKIGFSKEDAENIYQKYERIPSWRDTDDWRSGDWYSLIFNVAWKSRSLPIKKRKTTYNDIYEQDKHASDILSMDVVSKTRRLAMDKVKIAGELVRMAESLTAANDPWDEREEVAKLFDDVAQTIRDTNISENIGFLDRGGSKAGRAYKDLIFKNLDVLRKAAAVAQANAEKAQKAIWGFSYKKYM